MGLTITTKGGKAKTYLPFCTKAGNSPYNKTGTKAWVEVDRIVDDYACRGGRLIIMRPVIDKLIFDYGFADCHEEKLKVQQQVLENIAKAASMQGIPLGIATAKNVGTKRLFHLHKTHEHNLVLLHKPTGAKTIIQLLAKKKGFAFMRCDLNPAHLGAEGMMFFRQFLQLILANDIKPITFETISKRAKSIKRIDIAVDMLGVDISDIEGRYVFKEKELKLKWLKTTLADQKQIIS